MNKFLLGVILILLVVSAVAFFGSANGILAQYAERLLLIAENVALVMMLVNGTFYGSRYFKIALFFVGLIILGALMKILHLQWADMMLTFPFLFLFVTYIFHFLSKREQKILDWLKVIALFVILIPRPLYFLRVLSYDQADVLALTAHVVFGITFIAFFFLHRNTILDPGFRRKL
jgi:hypothetical protein